MRTHRRFLTATVASAAATTLALTAAAAGPATAAAGSTTIQYTTRTVLVPRTTLKAQLLGVSRDGAVYTFRSRTGALRKLAKGKVMLLQDYAVRDVTKVATTHGHFVVGTTGAKLTDFIANGKLSWNSSLAFTKGFAIGGAAVPQGRTAASADASLERRFGLLPLAGPKPITIKGTANTWTYSVTFQPTASGVSVSIGIGKQSPVEVAAKITGTLANLRTAGNISVNHGKLASAKMLANSIKGQFKLEYSAKPLSQLGLGQAGGIKITLPAEIAIPFTVGAVPMFLGVKVAFFASAGFSQFDQQIAGSWTLDYDGQGGFSMSKSGTTSPAGALSGLGKIILNAANAVGKGPLSFVFGAQMPQLELGVGVKGLNVAGNVTLVGSTGIATFGAGCDTRQMEALGTAGASAKFFGLSANLGSATLFDKKVQAAYPAGCGRFPG